MIRISSRLPRLRGKRGQVMVLFALMLPVVIGFVGLSLAGSIFLNTKSALDQSTLVAAQAASSDACMTSKYSFDIYQCYGTSGVLPGPPFNPVGLPNSTVCSDGSNC